MAVGQGTRCDEGGAHRITALLVLATFTALGRPSIAAAPTSSESTASGPGAEEDAEHLFQQARALHDQKKWQEAEALYRQAWDRQRSFKIAANLAVVELKLEKPRDAAEHLQFALRNLPTDDPKIAEARARLEQMLDEASRQVGTVSVQVTEPNATISVDGDVVGTTPLESPLFVSMGAHVLKVEKAGLQSVTHPLAVVAGESYVVPIQLDPIPAPRPPPAPTQDRSSIEESAPRKSSSLRTVVLIGEAALTLTATGFGIAYAVGASDQNDHARQSADALNRAYPGDISICGTASKVHPPECGGLATSREHANELSRWETVAFVTAGGLAAATIATYLLWPAKPTSEQRGAGARPLVAVMVAPGVAGVRFGGGF